MTTKTRRITVTLDTALDIATVKIKTRDKRQVEQIVAKGLLRALTQMERDSMKPNMNIKRRKNGVLY